MNVKSGMIACVLLAATVGSLWYWFAVQGRTGQIETAQSVRTRPFSTRTAMPPLPNMQVTPVVAPPSTRSDMPAVRTASAMAVKSLPPQLARFGDTRIPLEERLHEIAELGKLRDAEAAKNLMSIGDAHVYVNRYAVEALGGFHAPEVRVYLQQKLHDPDALVACAAIRALGRAGDDAAIAALADALAQNHGRPDGHDVIVCTTVVNTLGLLNAPTATPALCAELARSEEKDWNMEYGSAVVRALARANDPQGWQAMRAYADRLSVRIPLDPMAKAGFVSKIAEARFRD